ncbi:hypothetical protein CCR75_004458 [Bremia lactucae]|uniref:Uncharacterized protein n=1 Tax=Bremia lactucae TaxID=4779 RepID=A0A976NY96_BRELC|nr:hypothetical protein CCR75_004458 [Bremia lactucae]
MDTELQSTRAQFSEVTASAPSTAGHVNKVHYLSSPSSAHDLDTPRGAEYIGGDGIPTGAWASGLFDCFDNLMPNCFMVTFCPCVALAQLTTRLGISSYKVALSLLLLAALVQLAMIVLALATAKEGHNAYNKTYTYPSDPHDKEVNGVYLVIALALQGLLIGYIWRLRVRTRSRFQLPGSALTDCISSWFCSCCAIAQLRTHVRCYQPGSCTLAAPDVLQAYPGKSYAV